MSSKVYRLGKSCGLATNNVAYHLWHERPVSSRYLHANYQQNLERARWYAKCDVDDLRRLCQADRQTMGRSDRFAGGG